MRSALQTVNGVENVQVDYAAKTATVYFDGAINPVQFVSALEEAGFGASPVH